MFVLKRLTKKFLAVKKQLRVLSSMLLV